MWLLTIFLVIAWKNGFPIKGSFSDEQLFAIQPIPWSTDIVNFLIVGEMPNHWSAQDKRGFVHEVRWFFYDDLILIKMLFRSNQ